MDPGSMILIGGMLVLLLLMFQRSSRQRRELAQVQSGLAPGAEVMMSSGLFGTVVAVDGDVVTLETSPGQTSRWDRRAVLRVVTPSTTAAEPATDRQDDGEPGISTTSTHPDETDSPGPA